MKTPDDHLRRADLSSAQTEIVSERFALPGETRFSPQVLPSGRGLVTAVGVRHDPLGTYLAVFDLQEEEWRTIEYKDQKVRGVSPHYDPESERLVYVRDGVIFTVRFDLERLKVVDREIQLDSGVRSRVVAELSVSNDGKLLFVLEGNPRKLVWVTPSESGIPHVEEIATGYFVHGARIDANDGTRLVVGQHEGQWNVNLYTYDLQRCVQDRRLTTSIEHDICPVWEPGGSRVAYGASSQSAPTLHWVDSLATSPTPERLLINEPIEFEGLAQVPTSWSPDGNFLAFTHNHLDSYYEVWIAARDDDGLLTECAPYVATRHVDTGAVFSPDGKWIAYESDETGRAEIYVEPFSWPAKGNRPRTTVSRNGGREPVWSRRLNPLRLFYRNGKQMMAVNFNPESSTLPDEPEVIFSGDYVRSYPYAAYDVASDGRFLMIEYAEDELNADINVIVNWPSMIERATQ